MYFGGDFVYYADAVVFHDCATGLTMNVEQNEVYQQVEKKYMKLKLAPQESVSLDLKGYIVPKPEGQEGLPYKLVITELIEMDQDLECDEKTIKTGRYAALEDTLSLLPDYTWENMFNKGKWSMVDAGEMILFSDSDTTYAHVDMWTGDLVFEDQTRYVKEK